jgi:nucleoside-diphosphate-sugar epimerase
VVLWKLWYPKLPLPFTSEFVDVRDVARVCVAALRAPPTSEVGRKRFLLASEPWAGSKEIYEYVSEKRPELKDRFTEEAKEGKPAPKHYIDNSRAREVLKLELTPWQDTVLDAFDTLAAYEKEWKAQGLTPS